MERRSKIVSAGLVRALLFLLAFACVTAGPTSGFSAEKMVSDKPIKITSDSLEADNNAKKIYFRGSVRAIQDDINITCDTMSVTYGGKTEGSTGGKAEGSTPSGGQDIEHIVAEGNVVITQGNRVITGKQAEFFQKTRTIVITGDPVAKEGQNTIRGGKITFYIDENKSVVEGARTKQVEAVIFPDQKNGG